MEPEWEPPRRFDSSLGTVRWNQLGNRDAEPIVLLHGTPFSSLVWREIAPALAQDHSVYVWDMPGYGRSEMVAGQDLSLQALTAVFGQLVDHWQLVAPTVIAHDSGGAVALGGHVELGIACRRLALVNAVTLSPWGSAFGELAGDAADTFARLPATLHATLLREYIASASSTGLRPDVLDALARPWLGEAGQSAFYQQLTERRGDEAFIDRISPDYDAIGIPVLVCAGEDDQWVPAQRSHELASIVPTARLVTFDGAGHLIQEDCPARLTAVLLRFLHDAPA